ncbi:hypothetical protein CPC16_006179 [Podila verticillata]|nr:hypothetical protein CPC16_006179 [Podila verticillata]
MALVAPPLEVYLGRMKGQRYDPTKLSSPPPPPPTRFAVLLSSFIGSFIGIAIVSSLNYNAQWFVDRNVPVLSGAFGASAVLIYGAIEAPLSQPRNVIGGHIMSSLIGVSLYKLFNLLSAEMFLKLHWLLCALAVSISLCFMQLTHTVHPPASATALIAVSGGQTIYDLGYWYTLCPVALGIAFMMVVAMVVNNVARKYPTHWWNPKTRKITVVDQDMSAPIADFVSNSDDECGDEACHEQDNADTVTSDGPSPSKLSTKAPSLEIGREHATQAEIGATSFAHEPSTLTNPMSPSLAHTNPRISSPRCSHRHHQHHEPQFAIYYGGENKEALRDGEKMHDERSSPACSSDVEKGLHHHHYDPRNTVTIEARGSPHPSQVASISTTKEEDYRSTIEALKQRVRELEAQAASSP